MRAEYHPLDMSAPKGFANPDVWPLGVGLGDEPQSSSASTCVSGSGTRRWRSEPDEQRYPGEEQVLEVLGDRVVRVHGCQPESLGPGGRDVDGEALALKASLERGGDALLVFDHQYEGNEAAETARPR